MTEIEDGVLEEVEQTEADQVKADKPLPALKSPTVNLLDEIRQAVALRCRETQVSFSQWANKLVAETLVQETGPDGQPRLAQEVFAAIDFAAKRGGGGKIKALEETLMAKDTELEELKQQLADLQG